MITLAKKPQVDILNSSGEETRPVKDLHQREIIIPGRSDLVARMVLCTGRFNREDVFEGIFDTPLDQNIWYEIWKQGGRDMEDCVGQNKFFFQQGNYLFGREETGLYIAQNLGLFNNNERREYMWALASEDMLNPIFSGTFASRVSRLLLG